MESFKHICERDGARQGCLGRTDALRRVDTSPITSWGASSRRGPGDLPPPGLAPALGGSDLRAPASPVARGRASRGRTCPVSGQIPEARSPPSVASGGLRSPAGGAGRPATHVTRSSPRPPGPPGLRTGAETNLTDSLANQERGRRLRQWERAEGGPLASSRPRPVSAECLQPSPARLPQCGARGGGGRTGGRRLARRRQQQQRWRSRDHTPPRTLPPLQSSLRRARDHPGRSAAVHARSILW